MQEREKFTISGTGCALVDYLYKPVNFNDPALNSYFSRKPGDGGLAPGKLVFKEEFEKYSGEPYVQVRDKLTNGQRPLGMNIGGPSVVSLIHAAQMLQDLPVNVRFYGCRGMDEGGSYIEDRLKHTPLEIAVYKTSRQFTPFTDVFSDPDYDAGSGERIFINNIGAARDLLPSDLDTRFFQSDLVVFGGTALVPMIHTALGELLKKAKDNNVHTVVNTVFDFISERQDPIKPWSLGNSAATYRYIDLLIADREESLRLSGCNSVEAAIRFFKSAGTGSVIITHGANEVHYFADNELFGHVPYTKVPVSAKVKAELRENIHKSGDTTGCGDNFTGGVIASMAKQSVSQRGYPLNLTEAVSWGVVSGGFTCFYNGGTWYEEFAGQKLQLINPYLDAYRKQTGIDEEKKGMNKLVLFGAGKIGRSFIGQIFSRGGFEVVFIDINGELIDNLNRHRKYDLVIKGSEGDQTLSITHVRGLCLTDREKVSQELADATLAAISVGQQGLEGTLGAVSDGLILRLEKYGMRPLDIIIGENMRNADLFVMDKLKELLPREYPLQSLVGLVETSLGKMVPIMSKKDLEEDPLRLFAEPYNTLIVAKHGFKNPVPEIADLAPKENIKAWVDRKLFIHNLGHVTAAYLGFRKNPDWTYIYEALEDSEIADLTRQTMLQSADILMSLHPGEFTPAHLGAHIDDLLERFQNKALGDTLFRVGCDLYRKLSPDDRVIAPIRAAIKYNMPCNLIFSVLQAALSFRAKSENGTFYPGDVAFFADAEKGIDYVLKNVCAIKEIIRQL